MTGSSDQSGKRADRLAHALRANLRRRKAQGRKRASAEQEAEQEVQGAQIDPAPREKQNEAD